MSEHEDWSPDEELAMLTLLDICERATAIIVDMTERLDGVRQQGQRIIDRRLAAHPDARELAAHAHRFYDIPGHN